VFQSFFHFYETIYVPDHAAPLNRWVHFVSNLAALACCTTGIFSGFLPLFLLGIWFQLGPPYLGHIAFEKTHRSIDQNPIFAAMGSWYTTGQILLAKQSVTHGPVPWVPPETAAQEGRQPALRRLLDRYGRNLHGFMALERGLEVWLDPAGDAGVAYVAVPGHWVAAGAPQCAEAARAEVAGRFADAARAAGARAVFFGVGPTWVSAQGCGRFDPFPIGRTPVWHPRRWPECLATSPKLRNRLRRAQREGVTVRPAPADALEVGGPLHDDLVDVVTRWTQQRGLPPLGFMTQLDLHHDADARRTWVAEGPRGVEGFAFCVPVPGRRGWLVEDLLVPRGAAPGTAEALIDHAMGALAAEGAQLVTLGMVVCADVPEDPSHPLLQRVVQRVHRLGGRAYPAEGLLRFRRKLRPHGWEDVFLASDGPVRVGTLVAVLRAFTGGLALFALHTLERAVARRAAPVARRLRPCELRRASHRLWCHVVCPRLPAGWGHT